MDRSSLADVLAALDEVARDIGKVRADVADLRREVAQVRAALEHEQELRRRLLARIDSREIDG